MRAVNLIPSQDGRGHAAGGSPSLILLAALALLVAAATAYTLADRAIEAKTAELARISQQASAVEARARDLKSYTDFANARKARTETVIGLVDSRFDWARAMSEVTKTLPSGAWITSLRATTSPSVSVDGTSDSLRGSLPVPAIELAGCAGDQEQVARVMASLRAMSNTKRVTLTSSEKQEAAVGSQTARASTDGCGDRARFSLSIFFNASGPTSGAGAGAGSQTTTGPSGGTTP